MVRDDVVFAPHDKVTDVGWKVLTKAPCPVVFNAHRVFWDGEPEGAELVICDDDVLRPARVIVAAEPNQEGTGGNEG